MARYRNLVGIRVTAKAAAENFKPVCQGCEARCGLNFRRGRRGFRRRNHSGGNAAGAARNGSEKNSRRQWSNEQSSAGGIGCEFVAIGKTDGHAGCQPPVYIEYGQCRALARNDAPRKQEDSRAGCRGRLLLWPRKRTKLCDHTNNSKKQAEPKKAPQGHAWDCSGEPHTDESRARQLEKNRTNEKARTTCQPGGKPGHPEKRGTARDRSPRREHRASEYRGRGRWEVLVYRDGPKRIARRKCRK